MINNLVSVLLVSLKSTNFILSPPLLTLSLSTVIEGFAIEVQVLSPAQRTRKRSKFRIFPGTISFTIELLKPCVSSNWLERIGT